MNTIDLSSALSNRKQNPFSFWHKDTEDQDDKLHASTRLKQDFLKLGIQPSFSFRKNDAIFTMGSCFARRLENT